MARLALICALVGAVGCGRQINAEWCAQPGHSDPACLRVVDAGADAALIDAALIDAALIDAALIDAACPAGGCVDNTLYAAPVAAGPEAPCTISERCALSTALGMLDRDHAVIDLKPGDYVGPFPVMHNVRIVGNRATIRGTAVGSAIAITAGVVVELTGMTITGAANGSGVSCVGSTLRADHLEIFDNKEGLTSECALTLRQSRIYRNRGGALSMKVGPLDVHDNFFVKNGTDMLDSGSNVVIGPNTVGSFDFNTVAYNEAKQTRVPGVDCQSTAVTFLGNLVTDNLQNGKSNVLQVAACDVVASFTASNVARNVVGFASPDALDFHLTAGSALVLGKVPPATCASNPAYDHDFDGDPRLTTTPCDYGADER